LITGFKAPKVILVHCGVVNVQHKRQKAACLQEKSLAPLCCVLAESRQLLSFPGEVKSTARETTTKQRGAVREGELTRLTGSSQLKKEIA
jgi:hypothetical protein